MNKVLIGILVGGVLGLLDGLAAYRVPEVRDVIASIVMGSTAKGILSGMAAGFFARRYRSIPGGLAVGFSVGLVLAFLAAAMSPDPQGNYYWVSIMLPGAVLGAVVGFTTQRYGRMPEPAR